MFLVVFAVLALGLGFWGYAIAGSNYTASACCVPNCFGPLNPIRPFTWIEALRCLISSIGLLRLYDLFQPGKDPWQLVIAQLAVPGVALLSAVQLFLSGVRKNIRTALARHKTNHTIVCGIGDVGMQVVQNLRSAGHHVVAIDLMSESPGAATCENSGVPVVQGDAKNPQVLLASGIRHAQTVVVTTGSDSENMDIALQIKAIHRKRFSFESRRLQVLAQMRNDWMHKRLMASTKASLGSADVDLRLFNPFTNAARMLIKRLHLPPSPEFAARTFVVIGFGAYGREIAIELIRSSPVALNQTLKILVFDQKADGSRERFSITDPAAAEMASVEFVAASVTAGSPDLRQVIEKTLESAGPLLGVALALGNDDVSLCAALEMRSLLDRGGYLHVPIYVRLEYYLQLGALVSDIESIARFGDRLQIFGTLEETLSPDVLFGSRLDAFAQALHDDYRHRSQDQINPQANVAWHELPEYMQMSNRWRADHTPLLMELAGLHLVHDVKPPAVAVLTAEQIELLAQLEHRRYTMERRLIDSRHGSARRATQHHNPHLEDWNQLTEEQKNWNRKEVARLPEIMAGLGIELHSVRTVRLYGEHLAAAAQELEQLAANPQSEHLSLIVDLDEAEAVRIAAGALGLPSLSLWLFSRHEPREFFERKAQAAVNERNALIQRASGWAYRDRVVLEIQTDH
jgi:uncharacterized UPF0146 family protein